MAPIVSIDIDHIAYDKLGETLKAFKVFTDHLDGKNGKLLGQFMVQAGGHAEIITVSKYDSFKQRDETEMKYMSDAKVKATWAKIAGNIKSVTNIMCEVNPAFDIEKFDANQARMIRSYTAKPGVDAAAEYPALYEQVKAAGLDTHCLTLLHPIFTPGPVAVIGIFGTSAGGVDEDLANLHALRAKMAKDPAAAKMGVEIAEKFQMQSNRLVTQITPAVLDFLSA